MSKIEQHHLDKIVKNYSPSGLSTDEAKKRLEQSGENIFAKEKPKGIKTFINQFLNPLSFILIFASALSIFMQEYSDAVIILSIVFLNSILGFIQEYRSEKAVEKLSQLIEKKVMAIRNKEQILIDVSQLVPGDTIILRGGDIVPADVKIIEANNLSVNESQLTGESIPINKVSKSSDLRATLLFSGSIIERGYCRCIVYATGEDTELGKIALLSKNSKKTTPYQKSLAEFSLSLIKLIGATIVVMLAGKFFTIGTMNELAEVILFTIALAMTVVPEALPMITTVTLSNGALRLSKQNVIAKRLSAIEDLGRIDILCTDKTGTLTEDYLTITEIETENQELFQKFAYFTIEDLAVKNKKRTNSFDRAFSDFVPVEIKEQADNWKQLKSIPFEPSAKRRRMIIEDTANKTSYLIVIGSPETIMELSEDKDYEAYRREVRRCGNKGIRQLAIGYKEINYTADFDILSAEKDLTFLGFAKLIDPIRKTAKTSIDHAKELGIKIKILTGDSPEVAGYVGREIGLIEKNEKIYRGAELEAMSPAQLEGVLEAHSVFALVNPEQKYKIMQKLKETHVVGYQGDGINDAPSLKLADVSVAVHNATDVAKDSADIILLEDDMEVIISGIRYGRSIFVNINKYIKHAMIGNIGNFFSLVFFYLAFAADLPMLPIQLLIANLIQDMPLMTVCSDSVDAEEVKGPKSASQVKDISKTSLNLGIFTAIYYLIYFMFIGTEANALTQTNLFLFFNFTQLLIIISIRTNRFFWKGTKPSAWLIGSILFFIVGSAAMPYIPFIAEFMGFVPLSLSNFISLIAVTLVYIFLLDIAKVLLSKWRERRLDPCNEKHNDMLENI